MIALRPVELADAYALWLWANDVETRRASGDREVIAWVDHCRWLEGHLASDAALGFVALEAGCPVGSIRFDTADRWVTARLSYVVAPESRGRGLGAAMVAAASERLVDRHPAVEMVAEVRGDNDPSARLFRRLGWRSDGAAEKGWIFRSGSGTVR